MKNLAALVLLCLMGWGIAFGQTSDAEKANNFKKQLGSPDSKKRKDAANHLGELGSAAKGAIKPLLDAAKNKNEDKEVRSSAIAALGKICSDPKIGAASKDVVETLGKILSQDNDKDKAHRAEAVTALSQIGESAVPEVSKYLLPKQGRPLYSEEIRIASADVLAKMNPVPPPAVETLGKALADPSAKVKTSVLNALKKLGAAAKDAADSVGKVAGEKGLTNLAVQVLVAIGAPAVPALLSVIKSQPLDAKTLPEVLGAINKFGLEGMSNNKEAIENLFAILKASKDAKDPRRKFASDALAKFGPDAKDQIPTFLAALKDENSAVHTAAALVLKKMGPLAVPALVKQLESKEEADRRNAAEALGMIGPDAAPAADALLKRLKDPSEEVVAKATDALDRIGKSPIPGLIALLKDTDKDQRAKAAEALGGLGPRGKEAVDELRKATKDAEPEVRAKAIAALREIGPDVARSALPDLITALKDKEAEIRKQAAAAIAPFKESGNAAVQALAELLNDPDEAVRKEAADTLSLIGPASLPLLMQALADKESVPKRQLAAEALMSMAKKASKAVPALIEALKDPDVGVRKMVTVALREMGAEAKDAVIDLTIMLLKDTDKDVRENACLALIQINPDPKIAFSAYKGALRDKEENVRRVASEGLGKLGPPAIPALLDMLKDKDKVLRKSAAEALGAMGPKAKSAEKALNAAAEDKEPEVKEAAREALKRLTAKKK